MADTELNIRLNAYGGDNAAGDINKARVALENVQRTGTGMGETFGRRFSAVGLDNLNGALLHSIQYTGQMRPVMSALNMTFFSLMSSVGATTSAFFPYIMVAGAVVAVIAKMKNIHDDATQALQRQLDALIKSGAEAKTDTENFNNLHAVLKDNLTPAMIDYEKSIRNVNAAQSAAEMKIVEKQIDQTKKSIVGLSTANKDYKQSIDEQNASQAQQIKGLDSLGVATPKIVSDVSSYTKQIVKNEEETKRLNDTLAKQKLLLEALSKGYTSVDEYLKTTTKLTKDAKDATESQMKSLKEAADKAEKLRADNLKKAIDEDKKLQAEHKKALNDRFALEKSIAGSSVTVTQVMAEKMKNSMGDAYVEMTKGAGDAFASMIMDGKAFNKSMEEVFKGILKSFISMVAEMALRWAAMKFVTGILGIPVGGGMATGGEKMVDKPTMFLAGEAGPERVSVTPMGSNRLGETGGSRGGDTVQVSNTFTISGAGDPNKIAEVVAQKIIYSIRGRGQLNFVRGGA